MAGATSMLLLGLVEFRDAYQSVNLLDDMYDCVRWPLDYFVKAHPSKFEFYAMVADPYVDHSYWGRPEDMTMYRPAYKLTADSPGSDIIGETAAAMAAGSIAFKEVDPKYSELLLSHAKEMFEFADRYRGLYSDSLPIVQEFYASSAFNDELSWAAAWLYRATGDKQYLQKAEENYESRECWAVSWDAKDCLAALLLYKLTKKEKYRYDIERTMRSWMPGGSVDYTPGGLAFRTPWGPLRYTANMATLALVAANAGIQPVAYRSWARSQIHYMLGDSGRSFVVGFGHDPPTRPHHAASSCPSAPTPCTWSHYTTTDPNPITLYGALVGGPSGDDSFHDYRGDYYQSEVTCDYNSGFQSALAGLIQLETYQKELQPLGEVARQWHSDHNPKGYVKIVFPTSQSLTDMTPPVRRPSMRYVRPTQRLPTTRSNAQNGLPNVQQQIKEFRPQSGLANSQQQMTSFPTHIGGQNQQQSRPTLPQQNVYQRYNDGKSDYSDSLRNITRNGPALNDNRWWYQKEIRNALKDKSTFSREPPPQTAFVPNQFQERRHESSSFTTLQHKQGIARQNSVQRQSTFRSQSQPGEIAQKYQLSPFRQNDVPLRSPFSPQSAQSKRPANWSWRGRPSNRTLGSQSASGKSPGQSSWRGGQSNSPPLSQTTWPWRGRSSFFPFTLQTASGKSPSQTNWSGGQSNSPLGPQTERGPSPQNGGHGESKSPFSPQSAARLSLQNDGYRSPRNPFTQEQSPRNEGDGLSKSPFAPPSIQSNQQMRGKSLVMPPTKITHVRKDDLPKSPFSAPDTKRGPMSNPQHEWDKPEQNSPWLRRAHSKIPQRPPTITPPQNAQRTFARRPQTSPYKRPLQSQPRVTLKIPQANTQTTPRRKPQPTPNRTPQRLPQSSHQNGHIRQQQNSQHDRRDGSQQSPFSPPTASSQNSLKRTRNMPAHGSAYNGPQPSPTTPTSPQSYPQNGRSMSRNVQRTPQATPKNQQSSQHAGTSGHNQQFKTPQRVTDHHQNTHRTSRPNPPQKIVLHQNTQRTSRQNPQSSQHRTQKLVLH